MSGTTVDPNRRTRTAFVLGDVVIERRHQAAEHAGQADIPDGTGADVVLLDHFDLDGYVITFGSRGRGRPHRLTTAHNEGRPPAPLTALGRPPSLLHTKGPTRT